MPHSADEPSSAAPTEVVDGQGSDASRPSASTEDASNGSSAPSAPVQQEAPRRRRRRRRPSPQMPKEPSGDTLTGQTASAGDAMPTEGPPDVSAAVGEPHRLPHRRRHRRRGSSRGRAQGASASGAAQVDKDAPAAEAEPSASGEDSAHNLPAPAAPAPGDVAHEGFRRRFRRRRRPRADSLSDSRFNPDSQEASEAVDKGGPASVGRSRAGGSPNRRPRRSGEQDRGPQSSGLPDRSPPNAERPGVRRRTAGSRGRAAGPPRERARGAGDPYRRRGREAPPKKPELKLYGLESVVDRGFEDVPDNEASEGGTRRVHWTIIKRTVADQKSGKPMSAVYILQREGTDAEFPNLGAARAAVNKTIVHPEKLTMSKAEHAAAKN
jgi:hypothetical protein